MLDIDVTIDNDKIVYSLVGNLNTSTAQKFRDCLELHTDFKSIIVFDFLKIKYISSDGLRVLLDFQLKVDDKKGELKIINVSSDIMEVLELTGFTNVLVIESSDGENDG